MQTININDGLYEALGPEGAKTVAAVMLEKGVVPEPVEIKGDASVPVPDMNSTVYGMTFSEAMLQAIDGSEVGAEWRIRLPRLPRIPNPLCRAACDAAAAAAAAALTLSGPALAAALAAIAVARNECRRRC